MKVYHLLVLMYRQLYFVEDLRPAQDQVKSPILELYVHANMMTTAPQKFVRCNSNYKCFIYIYT